MHASVKVGCSVKEAVAPCVLSREPFRVALRSWDNSSVSQCPCGMAQLALATTLRFLTLEALDPLTHLYQKWHTFFPPSHTKLRRSEREHSGLNEKSALSFFPIPICTVGDSNIITSQKMHVGSLGS